MSISNDQAHKIILRAQETIETGKRCNKKLYGNRIFIKGGDKILFHPYLDRDGFAYHSFKRHLIVTPDILELPCLGDSCKICRKLRDLPSWGDKWKFRANNISFGYAAVLEYTGNGLNQDFKDTPVFLMNQHYDIELAKIIGGLGETEEAVIKFFDSESETPTVRAVAGSSSSNLSMSLDQRLFRRHLLPQIDTLEPLSAYINNVEHTEEKEGLFIRAIEASRDSSIKSGQSNAVVTTENQVEGDQASGHNYTLADCDA